MELLMHRFVRLTLVWLIAAAFGTASAALAQEKKDQVPHPKTLDEFKAEAAKIIEREHLPGAGAALVANGDVLWCGGFGKADVAAGKDITCDTEFRVGSISKTFVALALLQLQEAGKIDLQARVHDIAPEVPIKNQWEETNPVRVANLLEYTAGFDDMHASEVYNRKDPPDYPLLRVFQDHPGPQTTRWPPSTRGSYSNPGYGVAGYLIEKVSGQAYDAYIKTKVLTPLGIDRGDFRLTDTNRALLAQGYHSQQKLVTYTPIYLRPAGDMKASPGELAKLVQFFLRRGRAGDTQLIKPEDIVRMEYPATPDSARHGVRVGYGLGNYAETEGGVVTHGHDGGIDGFISSYRYMPEQNWGYVVLLNCDASGKALQELNRLAIEFLAKDTVKAYRPVAAVSPAELQALTGYYAPKAPRNQQLAFLDDLTGVFRIREADGVLWRSGLIGDGKPEKLLPLGKNLFRGENDPEATSIFFTGPAGKMIYTGSFGTYAERTSVVWPWARIALLALCAALLVSSLLFALVWVVMLVIGKMKGVQHLRVRVVPFFASVVLLAVLFSFPHLLQDIGTANVWSVTVFAGTIVFAFLSLWGLWLALYVPKSEIRRGVRIHSLLVSIGCVVLTWFLASWHLLGMRMWAP
jgi:CubicO group peptidase (beta-lactamase class C family)